MRHRRMTMRLDLELHQEPVDLEATEPDDRAREDREYLHQIEGLRGSGYDDDGGES